MKLRIGEKVKELRKRDDRTQDDLARALGVSAQAVSRWEANGGYPDMEIIPSIANYFHITIDELFGYDDKREDKIREIISRADIYLGKNEDLDECVEMLRKAASEFPFEAQIIFKLGLALSAQAMKKYGVRIKEEGLGNYREYDTEYNSQNEFAKEAVSVFEKVLDMDISPYERTSVVFNLTVHYSTMGLYDKAKELAWKQSPIDISREFILSFASSGEERDIYNSNLILVLLRMLKMSSVWAVGTKKSVRSSEYAIGILLSIADVYKAIIYDENYGVEHSELSDIYISCAAIYARMKNTDEAIKYLDLAIFHKNEYDKIKTGEKFEYSSELFSSFSYMGNQLPEFTMASLKDMCKNFPDGFKEMLKKRRKISGIYLHVI